MNKLVITTNAHQPSTRWYSGAGVYRDVYLWHGGDIRIEPWDVFVSTPSLHKVKVSYEISSDRDADVTLAAEIIGSGRAVEAKTLSVSLKACEKTPVTLEFEVKDARAWSTEYPFHYTFCTILI